MINPKLLRIKRKTAGWKLYLEITCLSTMLTQDQIKAASSEKRIHILENLFTRLTESDSVATRKRLTLKLSADLRSCNPD